jgi:hypothetical protein
MDTPPRNLRTPFLAVLAVIALAAAFRVRVAAVPLERDEGEYAYAGQRILHGVPPYAQAYDMKFPGTYYAYSAIMALAGTSARAIHLGLMLGTVEGDETGRARVSWSGAAAEAGPRAKIVARVYRRRGEVPR